MQLRLLSASDLRAVLDMSAAIDVVAQAFAHLSEGRARAPLRTPVEVEGGVMLVMPGWVAGPFRDTPGVGGGADAPRRRDPGSSGPVGPGGGAGLGAKIVSAFPGNADRRIPSVNAVVLLVDPETGVPRAVVEGTALTALRTGAASGAATRRLSREDAEILAVFGAGAQARTQIEAVRCVRPITEVRLVSRSGTSARSLAEELSRRPDPVRARAVTDPGEALAGADVVVAATDSPVPVLPGDAVEPGTHVNGVGSYTAEMREVDGALVARSTVVVDEREAAWAEAGDLVGALRDGLIGRDHVRADLGEVVRGVHPGRTRPDEITFFKSVGNAVQDVAVASEAVRRAERADVGRVVEL